MVYFVSLYLFLGVILVSLLFVFTISKGKAKHSGELGLLCLATTFYIFGYLLELNTVTLEKMKFWNLLQFLGMPLVPGFWLHLSWVFMEKEITSLRSKIIAKVLIFIIPISTMLMRLTNPLHGLYYKEMYLKQLETTPILYLEKGPWFYVQTSYILITLVLSNLFFFLQYRKSKQASKAKFRLLIMATSIPVIGLFMIILDFGHYGVDYTAMLLPFSVLLIFLALTKYDFLEIKYLARERIFEDSSIGMLLLNAHHRIMDYNQVCLQFFEKNGISMKHEKLEVILASKPELFQKLLSQQRNQVCLVDNHETQYFEFERKELLYHQHVYGYLISIENVTQREILQQKLKVLATTDPLTGLFNHGEFMKKLSTAMETAREHGHTMVLVMFDLDHFKAINDQYGHVCGDQVLKEMARLMTGGFRKEDLLGRVGGEEFAVLLQHCNIEEAYLKVDQFRIRVEENRMRYHSYEVQVTTSIGMAEYDNEVSVSDWIEKVDAYLYQSKKNGRNQCSPKLFRHSYVEMK
ncbi:MAG: diguanylate cyclase [Vallitaleaceae bacterium]|nr:diguanylate cyclase [Vallitaleaceae bacterium]